MATNFPTSLDTLTNPTGTDNVATVDHAAQHANANDAIEALQAKVGVDGSAVNTSHDFKLSGVADGDYSASLDGTETLTNKTLTTPTIGSFANATHDHTNAAGGGQLDHGGALSGLTDDDHTQYALLAGRASGQTIIGDTASGGDLTLASTSNATKGDVIIQNGSGFEVFEGIKFSGAIDENIILIPDNIDGNALEINDDTGGATLMRFKTANGFEEVTMYSPTKVDNTLTVTGTTTLATGLTGVLRADSGVVSTDSDVTDLVDNLAVSQLADGTDGELITWSATGAPTTVATGTSGHVLTSNGAGAAPTFQAASGGISDVVDDTTPQLGGNLDVNGYDITSPDGTDKIDIVNGTITVQTNSSTRFDVTDSGVQFGGSGARITTVLDEDTMSTDSATALATQQSIKAYVDTEVAGAGGGLVPLYGFSTVFETEAAFGTVEASGGTITVSNDGCDVAVSTTSGSRSSIYRNNNSNDNEFDMDSFFCVEIDDTTVGADYDFFAVAGYAGVSTGPTDYTYDHYGYSAIRASSSTSVYGTNGTDAAQTQTAFAGATTQLMFTAHFTAGTNVKFYNHTTLEGTSTTNLPVGTAFGARLWTVGLGDNNSTATTFEVGFLSYFMSPST